MPAVSQPRRRLLGLLNTARAHSSLHKTRDYVNDASASEIAKAEAAFPDIDLEVLTDCIAISSYGLWTRHIDITQEGYDAMLDIFECDGKLRIATVSSVCARHQYNSNSIRRFISAFRPGF